MMSSCCLRRRSAGASMACARAITGSPDWRAASRLAARLLRSAASFSLLAFTIFSAAGAGEDRLERQLLLTQAQAGQFRQVLGEHHGLQLRVDGVAGIIERFGADNLAGDAEEARSRRGGALEDLVRLIERLPLAVGGGDLIPHFAGFGAEFGIALDGAAALGFVRGLARRL